MPFFKSHGRPSASISRILTVVSFFTLCSLLAFYLSANSTYLSFTSVLSRSDTSNGTWLSQFASHPQTQRIGCREYDAGAQSCVFQGLACINTSVHSPDTRVFLVDDTLKDYNVYASDDWCELRHLSTDPQGYATRHWPIVAETIGPQRSCLHAEFRTSSSLQLKKRVKWFPNIWLVNLDYDKNNHNNHLLMDIIWLLDVRLWDASIDAHGTLLNPTPEKLFDTADRRIYLPQSRDNFIEQTSRDVNRLMYALILELDTKKLYPNDKYEELHSPPPKPRETVPLFSAYPELEKQLAFHKSFLADNSTDLVCTPRLTVGAKVANGAHERVCRRMREGAFELFNITRPEMVRLGQIYYPRPPKRVVILQRHVHRKLANIDEVELALRKAFEKYGVEVEVVSTTELQTAEEFVRVFSRAGVLLTSHGSQNMGQIFMQRHAAIIEVMPKGYTDYTLYMLSESCKIWYYELQSQWGDLDRDFYMKECGDKEPHMLDPCSVVKYNDVWVDVAEAVKTVRFALERLGYVVGEWLPDEDRQNGEKKKKKKKKKKTRRRIESEGDLRDHDLHHDAPKR